MTATWDLSPWLRLEQRASIGVLTLNRPQKRNALDDGMIRCIGEFFAAVPAWAKAIVITAEGPHFSAGLDLSELSERDLIGGVHHSRMWQAAFAHLEGSPVPVIAVLKGAVVGGGLELAAAAHLRVAEQSAFFGLPEGSRGLFVGGGASVRVPRLIGVQRMRDMMLTGRVLSSHEGVRDGLADYLAEDGDGLERALELAERIAANSPVTNFAIQQVLPRIAGTDPETGFLVESLMAAIAQSSTEAKQRMADFLAGKAAKVTGR